MEFRAAVFCLYTVPIYFNVKKVCRLKKNIENWDMDLDQGTNSCLVQRDTKA